MTTTQGLDQTHDGSAAPHTPVRTPDGRGLSFGRLLRTELRKTVNTRGGRWLLIAIVVITAGAMGLVMWFMRDPGAPYDALMAAAVMPQAVLLPVLGIMTAASEWSQRTALITFAQEPRRLRVMLAKLLAATILGLGVLAITLALAVLAHLLSVGLGGGDVDLDVPGHFYAGIVATQVIYVLMGVAFGALLLNVPLAIAAFFVLPVIMNLLTFTITWLRDRAAWIDQAVATQAFMDVDVAPSAENWQQLGTTTLLWVGVPLAIGLWRVARREIK